MPAMLRAEEKEALEIQFDALSANGFLNVLTRRHFTDLAALECDEGAVVSLYVDLTPQSRHNDAWAIDLKNQTRRLLAESATPHRDMIEQEAERMRRWLEDRVPRLGRGAAIFSCPARGLWWSLSLPVAFPTRLRAGRRPYLRPLARVRDEHNRFGVVVLDKHRARLFVAQFGQITEVADMVEDVPKHHKQGGRSQMSLQRHHDAHVMWHAGAVAHATELLMERFEARYLLVSGTRQVLGEYRVHLGPSYVRRWMGEFTLPIDASLAEVAKAIEPLEQRTEAKQEAATLARLENSIPGKGTWGLENTLLALEERRIQLLLVHDQYRVPGRECMRCHMLLSDKPSVCPSCGGTLTAVPDLVDAMLERAVMQEAELELVRSDEVRKRLPVEEPIGALFRF
jgi:Bacterial archaeo-eukaryotic release factor family 10